MLADHPPFDEGHSAHIESLGKHARVIEVEKPRVVLRRGDWRDAIFFLAAGTLEQWLLSDDGSVTTTGIFYPGAWISWVQLFDPRPAPRDLVASRGSTVIEFDGSAVRQLLSENSELYPKVIKIISRRIDTLMLFQETISITNRTHRLASVLLILSNTNEAGCKVIIAHNRLARMLVCSRTTLHRCLKTLQDNGSIKLGYGCIEILDREQLLGLSMFDAGVPKPWWDADSK